MRWGGGGGRKEGGLTGGGTAAERGEEAGGGAGQWGAAVGAREKGGGRQASRPHRATYKYNVFTSTQLGSQSQVKLGVMDTFRLTVCIPRELDSVEQNSPDLAGGEATPPFAK